MPTYPSLPLFPIMLESSRQCPNFHDHAGIFYALFPFPLRDFPHHVGIFPHSYPICRENPLFVDGRDSMQKKTAMGNIKIFL